jgi:hypothetical protein
MEPKSVNSKISGSRNFCVVYDSSKDVNLFIVIFADRQAHIFWLIITNLFYDLNDNKYWIELFQNLD